MLILQEYQAWAATSEEREKFEEFVERTKTGESVCDGFTEIYWQLAQMQAAMTQMAQRIDTLDKKCEFIAVPNA